MGKYDLGWRDFQNSGNWAEESTWPKQIMKIFLVAVVFYLIIGLFSLLAIAAGADISYMPFWHEPWRIIFSLFLKGKGVVPSGISV